ncbi:hypothetical protein CROQUDRAFT_663777 [Cronartium quercuum f. sp. fusiforme G11]|uniref:Phospholipase D/nuclease n=1 Tax=Cronartium quercuum f. sp. fusiforme G11 TaxID=708437 RepID=A0A9P6N9I6_9BASI|nr:hypothetical protein CROQUDRAFT_663777 [Cronartium quercuum f. sp. fusiforme G11]
MASNNEPSKKPVVIDLLSSDEEDQQVSRKRVKRELGAKKPSTPLASSSILCTLPDRAQLEAERLARARAREEEEAKLALKPVGVQTHCQPPRTLAGSFDPPRETAQSRPSSSTWPGSITSNAGPSEKSETNRYWKAAIKLSYNSWYPDSPNSVRAEDIVSPKGDIIKAIVSSYVVDLPWLRSLFDPSTPLMVIKHHKDVGTFAVTKMPNTFLCHPPMKLTSKGELGHGAMHVKFFIIYYHERVRVAIPTGNAVDFDYEQIENSIWIQDFPRREPQNGPRQEPGVFQSQLQHMLERMRVPPRFAEDLNQYNFDTAKARLVASIQGSYSVEQAKYGLVGLSKQIRALGLQSGPETGRSVELECQGSSIGAYDNSWLRTFHDSASGRSPTAESSETKELPPVKIGFPTLETIDKSKGGRPGAQTLFCNTSSWSKPGFPRSLFVDSMSKRTGLVMHVKMILGIFMYTKNNSGCEKGHGKSVRLGSSKESTVAADLGPKGFHYVGSHNFTPAAWGRLKKSPKRKKGEDGDLILEISNWELGVIMPLEADADIDSMVPWQRPAKRYGHSGSANSKVPWMQFSHTE